MQKYMPRPRILLADDFPQLLEEAEKLLRNDFEIVGFAHDGGQALRLALTLNPDILLLDISMPVLCGFEVAARLKQADCATKIIFVTIHEDRDYSDRASALGASAYIVKCRLRKDLLPAMHAVLRGRRVQPAFKAQVSAS